MKMGSLTSLISAGGSAIVWFTLICFLGSGPTAFGQVPTVSFSVGGTANNYTLDFSVLNNMNPSSFPGMSVYLFGVSLPQSISASPANFAPFSGNGGTYDPGNLSPNPGPSVVFDNVWEDTTGTFSAMLPGQSSPGFDVSYAGATPPSSVQWFALEYVNGGTGNYTGGDNFYTPQDPGFDGFAVQTVPEPGVLSLAFGMGASCLAHSKRRSATIRCLPS